MATPPDELKNLVTPGRLTDPFHDRDGAVGATRRYRQPKAPPKNILETPFIQPKIRSKTPGIFSRKRKWPYYMSSNTETILDKAIAENRTTEDEVPMIMRIALAVAQSFRRNAPTITDLASAIEFRTEENLRQIIAGEVIITTSRNNPANNSGLMNPRQLQHYWSSLAAATLAHLEKL